MSCLGFCERPLLTKKAWKRFTSKLRIALSKVRRPEVLDRVIGHRRSRRSGCHVSSDGFHVARFQRRHGCAQFSPLVYVDELYEQAVEAVEARVENTEAEAAPEKFEEVNGASAVDVRAEMFIRKFKKEREMERQRSFEEYQQKLDGGFNFYSFVRFV